MKYHQLTSVERYALSALRKQGCSQAEIARVLGRHRSTIGRELERNSRRDGGYRPSTAGEMARGRLSRSRRNWQFTDADWALVQVCLNAFWSPEQIAGRLRRFGVLSISHETIYRYVWKDLRLGGRLHRSLRGARKRRRKRYRSYDSRGRLEGKRHISLRPAAAENRSELGHLEGDTMMGGQDPHCVMTLVDRKAGYVFIGKMRERTARAANQCATKLLTTAGRRTRTLTYFATPHHSWERGTNENTNGLIRQYLPKRKSMKHVTENDCDWIAQQLNNRPRKRLGYLTPAEVYEK